jgi:transcriptional regulator with XRE-family HTH domain
MMPDELKQWRRKYKYSQATLAKALGVFYLTISKWECGERTIPPFLHLALKTLEKKEVKQGSRKRKRGNENG